MKQSRVASADLAPGSSLSWLNGPFGWVAASVLSFAHFNKRVGHKVIFLRSVSGCPPSGPAAPEDHPGALLRMQLRLTAAQSRGNGSPSTRRSRRPRPATLDGPRGRIHQERGPSSCWRNTPGSASVQSPCCPSAERDPRERPAARRHSLLASNGQRNQAPLDKERAPLAADRPRGEPVWPPSSNTRQRPVTAATLPGAERVDSPPDCRPGRAASFGSGNSPAVLSTSAA